MSEVSVADKGKLMIGDLKIISRGLQGERERQFGQMTQLILTFVTFC